MSASPAPPAVVPSQKRPLEEPSSDSGLNDQPEAKRPALDNLLREDGVNGQKSAAELVSEETPTAGDVVKDESEDVKIESIENDAIQDTLVPDAPTSAIPSAASVLETQPIQSTTSANGGRASSQGPFQNQHQDETGWLHIRSIISSTEAATVIGKGGENVTLIRRMSGAKCTVSDYARGAVERVLTVSGLVDAVAKVSPDRHLSNELNLIYL